MPVQMTRAQYETKYGQPVQAAPVQMTRAEYDAKYATPATNKSLGQKVLDTGTKVTNALGLGRVANTLGNNFANIANAVDPRTSLDDKVARSKGLEQNSLRENVGAGLQLASLTTPGAGVGAGLGARVGGGAAIGYAVDSGYKLQDKETSLPSALKPGLGTAIGTALPIAGAATGFANVADKGKKVAALAERGSLRFTPVEQQNLADKGKAVTQFLASKKIVGTPAQRLSKITNLYNDAERQIERVVANTKVTYSKAVIIKELEKIPAKYLDNTTEYPSVVSKINSAIDTIKANRGDSITGPALNRMKRAEWSNAFNPNSSKVVNEISEEMGHVFKRLLDKSIRGLDAVNGEYGLLIAARKQAMRAATRNQAGLFSRALGMLGGSAIGGATGGPMGAAAGALIGERAANLASTPVRSALGAGAQIAAELIEKNPLRGKVQPLRKLLINATQPSRDKGELGAGVQN